MRHLALACVLGAIIGCGGAAEPSIVGDWLFDQGDRGLALSFNADGTYVAQKIRVTSSTSGLDEAEGGTYALVGDTLTHTPKKWTCVGPYPAYSVTVASLGATKLAVLDGTTAISFTRETGDSSGGDFVITFGCFAADGTFTPREIAPVTN